MQSTEQATDPLPIYFISGNLLLCNSANHHAVHKIKALFILPAQKQTKKPTAVEFLFVFAILIVSVIETKMIPTSRYNKQKTKSENETEKKIDEDDGLYALVSLSVMKTYLRSCSCATL